MQLQHLTQVQVYVDRMWTYFTKHVFVCAIVYIGFFFGCYFTLCFTENIYLDKDALTEKNLKTLLQHLSACKQKIVTRGRSN